MKLPNLDIPGMRKWIKALRSYKYQQTAATLRGRQGKGLAFCCLGVRCEVDKLERSGTSSYMFDGHEVHGSIVGHYREKVGLPKKIIDKLVAMNDDKHINFIGIANYLEDLTDAEENRRNDIA